MPVAVRNNKPGPTVFYDVKSNVNVEWQGAGDPSGEDVQYVPDEWVKENADFRRALNRQVLMLVDESTGELAMEAQRLAYLEAEGEAQQAVLAVADDDRSMSLVSLKCVGPGTRAGSTCDATVIRRPEAINDSPPLCDTHAHLSRFYRANQTGTDPRTGEPILVWERIPNR